MIACCRRMGGVTVLVVAQCVIKGRRFRSGRADA